GEGGVSGRAPLRGGKAREGSGVITQVVEAHIVITSAREILSVLARTVQDIVRGTTVALGKLDVEVIRMQGDFTADRNTAFVAAQIISTLAVAQILGDAPEQRLAALMKYLFKIGLVGQAR